MDPKQILFGKFFYFIFWSQNSKNCDSSCCPKNGRQFIIYQKGYGSKAVELLERFFKGELVDLTQNDTI